MLKNLPLLLLSLLLAGCGHVTSTTQTHRTTLADQGESYDRYVERRTDSLYLSGAFKSRQAAADRAKEEAANRYGELVPEVSTTWTWKRNANPDRGPVKLSDLEKAAEGAKRGR